MTQRIDQEKLREAAEHLEWVLSRYHEDETMRQVWRALEPLIERAKRGEITEIIDSRNIPYYYAFGDGFFHKYTTPNFGGAYAGFITEVGGGLTEMEASTIRKLREIMVGEAKSKMVKGHGK